MTSPKDPTHEHHFLMFSNLSGFLICRAGSLCRHTPRPRVPSASSPRPSATNGARRTSKSTASSQAILQRICTSLPFLCPSFCYMLSFMSMGESQSHLGPFFVFVLDTLYISYPLLQTPLPPFESNALIHPRAFYFIFRNEKLLNDPVRLRQISERIPAGRWGEPRDFAGPAVFLASDASRYVCGELLVVDGVSVLPQSALSTTYQCIHIASHHHECVLFCLMMQPDGTYRSPFISLFISRAFVSLSSSLSSYRPSPLTSSPF